MMLVVDLKIALLRNQHNNNDDDDDEMRWEAEEVGGENVY